MKPKILLYDLETSAILGHTWRMYDTSVIKIKKDWELLSFSYKWLGSNLNPDSVTSRGVECFSRRGNTEEQLVKRLHKVLSEADAVITHNGVSFDNKKANAKFAQYRLPPVKPSYQFDTCRLAKSTFGFSSNSLDQLCKRLGLGQKVKYNLGFDLWELAMDGNSDALKKMERYNKHDIVLLEKLYLHIRPFAKSLPALTLLQGFMGCPSCGSKNCQKRGFKATAASVRQQWSCTDCGHWFQTSLKTVVGKKANRR